MVRKLHIEYNKSSCIGALLCMKEDPLHFKLLDGKAKLSGKHVFEQQSISILLDSFIDEDAKKIINAAQKCPANAIKIVDTDNNENIVSTDVHSNNAKVLLAEYNDNKDFIIDEKGYFLIRIVTQQKNIEVGFCNAKNKMILKIIGKKPIDIYTTICSQNLGLRSEHYAYLGRELQKAYIALQKELEYIQDDDLVL